MGRLLIVIFGIIAIIFLLNLGDDEKSDADILSEYSDTETIAKPAPEDFKYSSSAVATAKERIIKWKSKNHIKLDLNAGKAYVNSALWLLANVDQKKELMSTIMIYTESEYGKSERITRFYDYQTGKQIAKWTPIDGYDLDY